MTNQHRNKGTKTSCLKAPRSSRYGAAVAGAALLLCACSNQNTHTSDLTQWVNPMIGTDFTGNTYPGAQAPFGMVQLSPDNGLPGWDRISGYFYPDSTIAGFSHTHLSGTGAGDLYDISFMPVMRPLHRGPEPLGVFSYFSHEREEARAGYYSVHLDSYDIDVELTASPRCGIQRYTFPEGDAAVILNLAKAMNWDRTVDSQIEVLDSVTIAGYRYSDGWARNQKVYFATRFSSPFRAVSFTRTPIDNGADAPEGVGVTATFDYDTQAGDQLVVVTALSGVSQEGALANLIAEGTSIDFDKYLNECTAQWNKELSNIQLDLSNVAEGKERDDRRTVFYTALYHSMLAPTIFADFDGKYLGPDGQVHQADGWTNYSSFSLWDTYRAAHPLYTIIAPDRAADMAQSLIEFGDQLGRLPVWNMWASETDMMIGYHSAPVIADAILKGLITDEALMRKALDVSVATARNADYRQLGDYMQLGYVPSGNHDWSMSKTLEYAYDDWCIAQIAQQLGEQEIYDEFMARSANYLNTFNPATGFFQPRDRKGNYSANFVPEEYDEEICESNAWQYLFSVQHDIPSLIEAMGGVKAFEKKLDDMFSHVNPDIELPIFSTGMIGQYAQGNEPGHHAAYLYHYTPNPEKGADRLHEIMTTLYTNAPDGLCGNEDMGQMSAWFVLSALGFYPVNPVGGEYVLGTPMAAESTLTLANGNKFTIRAVGLSDDARYIASATLNGQPLPNGHTISHADILAGGTLELKMKK
ncbi:MAG: GH92 family glycosyl hydrolase [Bacteroidales bacterium]|nr:GH92 family glycosyl hydrolase [Bacteroidales bacterium]